MALFPAYARSDCEDCSIIDRGAPLAPLAPLSPPAGAPVSPARERALLASSDEEAPAAPAPAPAAAAADSYVDRRRDRANLPVSTLYYPGRPEYNARPVRRALGAPPRCAATAPKRARRDARYYRRGASGARDAPDAPAGGEAAARGAAYRRALADAPSDAQLWMQYIDFQEWCGAEGAEGAARAALGALWPHAEVRARALAALRRALSPHEYLERLRDYLAAEKCPAVRVELWERLLSALCSAPDACADGVRAAAARAVRDTRRCVDAYPRLLYVYCAFLRSGALWEQLVQLAELLLALSAPAAREPPFPPPNDAARDARADADLDEYELKTVRSRLPLGEVWSRVERARAALHWRALPAGARADELAADPMRAPAPHDCADLLLPVVRPRAAFRAAVALLRTAAEAPLLPGAGYVARAADGADAAAEWEGASGGALLTLLRAARRLPAAHAARAAPTPARRLLARTALRAYSAALPDPSGYGAWVTALWAACARWVSAAGGAHAGRRCTALLCWRLRALHAKLLLLPDDEEGRAARRRLRAEARDALRGHAPNASGTSDAPPAPPAPLPFAIFARLEAAAAADGAGGARAQHVALQALRAALDQPARDVPPHDALYIARVVCEVGGADSAEGAWALCCAALQRALPPADRLQRHPPPELLRDALQECEVHCDELERRLFAREEDGDAAEDSDDDDDGDAERPERLLRALLPGAAEWACARAALAPPRRVRELRRALWRPAGVGGGWAARRYCEQSACAVVAAARSASLARALSPRFPHNGYLALMGAGAPLWARAGEGEAAGGAERLGALLPPYTAAQALAAALPALLRAEREPERPHAAERAARAARRALRGGAGGAALHALLLEAEARAPRPRALAALTAAVAAHPHHKLLYARGAALCPSEAAALPDLLLQRQLRLHALPDELHALHDELPAHAACAPADCAGAPLDKAAGQSPSPAERIDHTELN